MSSARSTPSVPQPPGDTQYNVHDAALRGASSAFSKPALKPKPQVNTYTGGSNGALLAATKVGTGTPTAPSPVRNDWTGGSNAGRPNISPMQALSKSSSSSTLEVPSDYLSDRTTSPSNIAAKLAAARHSPMKPMPSSTTANERDVLPPVGSVGNVLARFNSGGGPPLRRADSTGSHSVASTVKSSRAQTKTVDDAPIPPTASLTSMFEAQRPTTPVKQPTRAMQPILVAQQAPPPVRSPKPQRKIHLPPEPREEPRDSDFPVTKPAASPPVVKPKPKPNLERKPTVSDSTMGSKDSPAPFSGIRKDSLGTPPISQKPPQLKAIKTSTPRQKPPVRRDSRPKSHDLTLPTAVHRRLSTSMDSTMSSPSSYTSAPEIQEEEKPKPAVPPPRRSTKARSNSRPTSTPQPAQSQLVKPQPQAFPQPRSSPKPISPVHPPEIFPPRRPASTSNSSPPANSVYHSNYQRESVRAITKHMTGESLSNAIVGAALASSRTASPASRPAHVATPPLPTRRHHHSPFYHGRSPSPTKPPGPAKMRTTMRKEKDDTSDEDESERYKRKGTRIMGMRQKKHPNKHHEGDRKRWRDVVTERERRRYEGVWAANKGLYVADASRVEADTTMDVHGLLTKEIWSRSRLPVHELEEVWDLVDTRTIGRLRREEFVVGLWLIDQRLKGRKLPPKVRDSVWGSVRGVGVKVKVHG
ncbi:hypothetical protein EJ04DRAFT_494440 [Polyplosphaeria fusca]|uniref:EH domain-containing protein n=1 Tax=Polyplosphaeria fusca TaxID=682080 RepID=A0A9P4V0T8_9PLEO|nr:hypothetical protein EJ04DRAFT_494440 [Polyplosphaeria fusca]